MKLFRVAISALLSVVSVCALADEHGPLVVKTSGSGYVPDEWRFNETCELYSNRVEIKKTYGVGATATEIRSLKFTGPKSLTEIVKQAAQEPVEERPSSICDGPTTFIGANVLNPDDTIEPITLFTTGGCGSPRQRRNGPASAMLTDLVNGHCSKFFEMAR